MISSNDFRPGVTVEIDGNVWQVVPSTRRQTNTSPATSGRSWWRRRGQQTRTPCIRTMWRRCGRRFPRTWTPPRSTCAWARRGSTRSISSSSCMRSCRRRGICAGEYGSCIPSLQWSGLSPTRPPSPTTMWRPT